MTGLLSAWLVEAGIVTWRAFKREQRPPLPSDFVAVFILYGSLGMLAEVPHASSVAAATGWGIVLATALNLVDPSNPMNIPGTTPEGRANRARQTERHGGQYVGGGGASGSW